MDDFRDILYDTQWQRLRVELKPFWSDPKRLKSNLATLQAYMDATPNLVEFYLRVCRVTNLLVSLPEGKKDITIDSTAYAIIAMYDALRRLREVMAPEHPVASLPSWDWDLQRSQLRTLLGNNPAIFDAIYDDLLKRSHKLPKAQLASIERYLSLMREVSYETLT